MPPAARPWRRNGRSSIYYPHTRTLRPERHVLEYRLASQDDIPAAARLVAHSFPGPLRPPSWWESQLEDPKYGGGPDTLLVGTDANRIVAACQIHPLRQWVAGRLLPVTGVGTVAIAPTHRRRRLGAELVIEALRRGRERGDVASALYPFRTSFYQKLGYGAAGTVLQYQIAPESLPDSDERLRVELMDNDLRRAEVAELYDRWARTQNGQLARGERTWIELCGASDRALVAYRAEDNAIEGYALVVYRADLPPRERYLEVDEIVWLTPRARRALYGWLSSLGDQWQSILLRALPSQRADDRISEPRLPFGAAPGWRLWAPGATLLYGTMFRVLDMRGAWEGRAIGQAPTMAVTLHVVDEQLPANSGTWRLALDQGRATIEQVKQQVDDSDMTIRLGMDTLSRLFIGSLSLEAGLDAGLLECDRPELMSVVDAALRLPEPWTFDRF
jgi:predicted acetyltransferase